jgi:hypothetical protein
MSDRLNITPVAVDLSWWHYLKYTSVRLDIPDKATVGDEVIFTVTGSIGPTRPNWPNFAIGIKYEYGPAESLKIILGDREHRIDKGFVLAVVTRNFDPGTTMTMRGRIKFELPGSYDLVGIAGYYDRNANAIVSDSRDVKTIEVREPRVEADGVGIPWWALALAGASVAVIATVGAVMYIEREREMRMLMLLLSR